jgi:addiction module HigA family antidote
MDKIPAAFSIHPGEILLSEFMEPLGLTAYRLAKDLHISIPRVNDLVRGKRGITADTALRLSRYFGNSAQFWLGLQSGYDLWVASRGKSWNKVKPREKAA